MLLHVIFKYGGNKDIVLYCCVHAIYNDTVNYDVLRCQIRPWVCTKR